MKNEEDDEVLKLNFAVAGGINDTDLDSEYLKYVQYEKPPADDGTTTQRGLDKRIDYNMMVSTNEGALPKTGLN